MKSSRKVLVLLHARPASKKSLALGPFKDAMETGIDNLRVDISTLEDLLFEVNTGKSPLVIDNISGNNICDYDLVFFRTTRNNRTQVSLCVQALKAADKPYIDSMYRSGFYSKLSGDGLRAEANIPVIPSFHTSNRLLLELANADKLPYSYPFILKDIVGRKGKNNHLITDIDQLKRVLELDPTITYVVQPFIENDGDYRVLVLGGRAVLVIHRRAVSGSHLNNVSAGGEATLIELDKLPSEVIQMAEKSAVQSNIEVAGVDILMNKSTREYYVLEVNSSPQLLSGSFVDTKMQAFNKYIGELLDK
ncbi:hypothetical protein KC878_02165 [Candidatus Saccharibacteria bacterium]|nr:hypothetical protein [Candidatus Saccharibacteria bacterium]MCB9820998.1 hypothetical protein [Candidatus Nomurabacteria bacterium]